MKKNNKKNTINDSRFMNHEVYVILPSIRSLFNVGSIFRTSDCAGINKIYLCGWTGAPPAPRLLKTSLGAEKTVPWEQHKQAWRLIDKLKKQGVQIIGLEISKKSIDYRDVKIKYPCALVVGNEVTGLSNTLLKRCDTVMYLPMVGSKESLNVSVAFGIAAYKLRFEL